MESYAIYSKTKHVFVNRFVSDPFKRDKIVSYISANKKLKRNVMTCATKKSAEDIANRLEKITCEDLIVIKVPKKGKNSNE